MMTYMSGIVGPLVLERNFHTSTTCGPIEPLRVNDTFQLIRNTTMKIKEGLGEFDSDDNGGDESIAEGSKGSKTAAEVKDKGKETGPKEEKEEGKGKAKKNAR